MWLPAAIPNQAYQDSYETLAAVPRDYPLSRSYAPPFSITDTILQGRHMIRTVDVELVANLKSGLIRTATHLLRR